MSKLVLISNDWGEVFSSGLVEQDVISPQRLFFRGLKDGILDVGSIENWHITNVLYKMKD